MGEVTPCCPVCDMPGGENPNPTFGAHFCEDCDLFYNGGPDEWLAFQDARDRRLALLHDLTLRLEQN